MLLEAAFVVWRLHGWFLVSVGRVFMPRKHGMSPKYGYLVFVRFNNEGTRLFWKNGEPEVCEGLMLRVVEKRLDFMV